MKKFAFTKKQKCIAIFSTCAVVLGLFMLPFISAAVSTYYFDPANDNLYYSDEYDSDRQYRVEIEFDRAAGETSQYATIRFVRLSDEVVVQEIQHYR